VVEALRVVGLLELVVLDAWQREIIGPLRLLPADRPIRIVLDGLDQLSTGANISMHKAIDVLATDPAPGAVRLVLTARSDTPLPVRAKIPPLGEATDGALQRCLERRGGPLSFAQQLLKHAVWLEQRPRGRCDEVRADHFSTAPRWTHPRQIGFLTQCGCAMMSCNKEVADLNQAV
jgi:hypothetical protein